MFKNHSKISLRDLRKNKLPPFLNPIGLSIGVSGVLTLLFSVYSYYTTDDTVPHREQPFYLKAHFKDGTGSREVPYPLMEEMVSASPQVLAGTHLNRWGTIWLANGEKETQHRTDYADPETALKEKQAIILQKHQ